MSVPEVVPQAEVAGVALAASGDVEGDLGQPGRLGIDGGLLVGVPLVHPGLHHLEDDEVEGRVLAPADVPKEGALLDLPIALCMMGAAGALRPPERALLLNPYRRENILKTKEILYAA